MSTTRDASLDARLDALARHDKWFLSCGDGVIWAPPFPVWLHVPGFWDEALVYYHPVAPLFAVALVRGDGRAVPLAKRTWRWRPHQLDVEWVTPAGIVLRECRYALPGGRLASAWEVPTERETEGRQWLVAFSIQPGEGTLDVAEHGTAALAWRRRVADRRGAEVDVGVRLEATGRLRPGPTVFRAARRSEGSVAQPHWLHTPFAELWTGASRNDGVRLEGLSPSGYVHLAVGVPVEDMTGAGPVVAPPLAVAFTVTLTAGWEGASEPARATRVADRTTRPADPWREHLEQFPAFACSDPYLSRYYDYRLYGLRLNRLAGGAGHVRHPAIAEGIGYFHVPITYSAQCHMWETRWSRDPAVATGTLRNFLAAQKEDGGLHGRLYNTHLSGTDFYHANWGDAVAAVLAVHDDPAFAREAYDGLARYGAWLLATRDAEGSGLFDVLDQYETGQEYMSRYLAVDADADRYGWENRIRLKGIDISVYAYQLFRWLQAFAGRSGDGEARARWAAAAGRTGEAIASRCWDPRAALFTDVHPGTLERTGVKAAVGFYPLLTDLVDDMQVAALLEHLSDPQTFGTPWPLPSSSVDDPRFDPYAEWKGKRHVCPWNGRVWPMTTSHVVEGLIRQWHRGRRAVGPVAADLLARFIRLLFDRGDLSRPTCYEHYNPFTGDAAFYRGIDDYMHSWVVDLIVRGVAGLEPTATGVRIDPLPLAVERVSLDRAHVRGHLVSVSREGERVCATVDGREHRGRLGDPLEIPW